MFISKYELGRLKSKIERLQESNLNLEKKFQDIERDMEIGIGTGFAFTTHGLGGSETRMHYSTGIGLREAVHDILVHLGVEYKKTPSIEGSIKLVKTPKKKK